MATRIILKDNEIGSTNPPSGYKFIGYNNDTLSERLPNGNINPIGGSLSDVKTLDVTLNKSQINNLHTASASVPFSSFDATAGESIIILPSNTVTQIDNDGVPFSMESLGVVRLYDSEGTIVASPVSQTALVSTGVYFGSAQSGALLKAIPNGGFELLSTREITGGGNNCSIIIKLYYQTFI